MRLLRQHLRAEARTSVLIALLVAITVGGVALAPRALARLGDREVRHALAESPPTLLDITGLGRLGLATEGGSVDAASQFGAVDNIIRGYPQRLPEPLQGAVGDAEWLVRSRPGTATTSTAPDVTLDIRLGIQPSWQESLTVVDGELPAPYRGRGPIEVALPRALAERLDLEVGDRIGYVPADLRVAAIFEVDDPDGRYAAHAPELLAPTVDETPGVMPSVTGLAMIDPESVDALASSMVDGTIAVWYPVDPARVSYADVDELEVQARRVSTSPVTLPYGGNLTMRSGLETVLENTSARITSTYSLLALAMSGVVGVLVAVFALAVGTLITRRRWAITLASGRGASELQIRGVMVVEGLLIAAPAYLLAIVAVTTWVPAVVGPVATLLPVLTALLVPVLMAVMSGPGRLVVARRDLDVREQGQVRLVLEIGVLALAAVSLLVLSRRGLVESGEAVGIDPLVVGAPLFVATAVCAIVLRVYPVPLHLLHRRVSSRDGAVAFLGSARAVRGPALGFAAALAMIVGMAVVTFSIVMASTVRSGLETSVREEVGADVRVSAQRLSPDDLDEVRRVAGVQAAAALTVRPGAKLDVGRDTMVDVVVADTAALHAVRPDLPVLVPDASGTVPLLLASEFRESLGEARLEGIRGAVVALADPDLLPGIGPRWVLVDESAVSGELADGLPEQLLVRGDPGVDAAALAGRVESVAGEDVDVEDVETSLAAVRSSPIVGGLEPALVVAALAALALMLLTVVLASLSAARSRQELVGVLRILGMSRRQLRGLVAWELVPVAATAVVVGTTLGLALPWVVTRVVDLRTFVGGQVAPGPVVEPLVVLAGVGVFVAGVAVAGLLAAALARRIAPADTIKMGER